MRISNRHRGPGYVLTLAVMAMMALAAFARPVAMPAPSQGPVLSMAEPAGQAAIEAWNATSLFLARQQESDRTAGISEEGADDDREVKASLTLAVAEDAALLRAAPRPGYARPHDASVPARIHARAPPRSLTA